MSYKSEMAKHKDHLQGRMVDFIKANPGLSSKEIHEGLLAGGASYATVKRWLQQLTQENIIATAGQGKGTRYHISPAYEILQPVNVAEYYLKEIDERQIKKSFNHTLIGETLRHISIFTDSELATLEGLQNQHLQNIKGLSKADYNREMERLAIDLSWKSSQIEGNTYSLLETERLLKEKETAAGKTKDEATMILNHKEAIDFILSNPNYIQPLTVKSIEDIHSMLIKELGIGRNIRKRKVGITGTNYSPLDNEFQIREALEDMCVTINKKQNVFEKSLLTLVLISYIQPFADGNKRTARIVSNAILMNQHACPLSFRTVDSTEYKKAMLIFYEQNIISAFKKIFMEQFEFAVKTYF